MLERKEKGKERVVINQDEREQIREQERRKILTEPCDRNSKGYPKGS